MSDDTTRLSALQRLILDLLLAKGEAYGLELVAASEGGLKRGTVYVLLSRMEDGGFIESRYEPRPAEAIGLPRRLYKVTGHGMRVMRAEDAFAAVMAGANGGTS